MCANQIVESLRQPTEEELAMLRHLRKGFFAARGLIAKRGSGQHMHDLINETMSAIPYVKPPPVLKPSRANASYPTPFKGDGMTIHGLSLAEYLAGKAQAGDLSLAELNAHLQLAGLQTTHEIDRAIQPQVAINADYADKVAADAAAETAQGELGAQQPDAVETEEDDEDDTEPASATEKVDKQIAAEEEQAAKDAENGPSLAVDPNTLEERLGMELTSVRVVCAAIACMVHAMRTLPDAQKNCNYLLKPLCVSFRGMTGCEQSCDAEEEQYESRDGTIHRENDGCVPLYKPIIDEGVYSYTDMAKKANIAASKLNHTQTFNYTKFMEDQGYQPGGPPEQKRQDKKLREEMEQAKTEDLDTSAAVRPR